MSLPFACVVVADVGLFGVEERIGDGMSPLIDVRLDVMQRRDANAVYSVKVQFPNEPVDLRQQFQVTLATANVTDLTAFIAALQAALPVDSYSSLTSGDGSDYILVTYASLDANSTLALLALDSIIDVGNASTYLHLSVCSAVAVADVCCFVLCRDSECAAECERHGVDVAKRV